MEADAKITIERIRELILADNPSARVVDVEQYAHQMLSYVEASESILTLGTITAHPRTAAPMENPYLKVRASSLAAMNRLKRLKRVDSLWSVVQKHLDRMTRGVING